MESTVGKLGNWGERLNCSRSGAFLKAARFKSEDKQPGDTDDTAGNSLNMKCTDDEIREGVGGPQGRWSEWVFCPPNTAICGIKTKVEPYKLELSRDNTALNKVTFYCCNRMGEE